MVETPYAEEKNTVSFYGYVRGTYLDRHTRVHINGIGDFDLANVTRIDDPVPIEMKKTVKQKQKEHELAKTTGTKQRGMRSLKDREKVLYAPFSNIGALNFDKSTGYITIPDKQVVYTRVGDDENENDKGNEGQQMMWKLQDL